MIRPGLWSGNPHLAIRVPKRLSCISARRPNSHRLFAAPRRCGTAGALAPDAISCLGAFRTPAAGARGQIIVAGVRKPAQSTKGDLPLSTKHLRVLSYQMLG